MRLRIIFSVIFLSIIHFAYSQDNSKNYPTRFHSEDQKSESSRRTIIKTEPNAPLASAQKAVTKPVAEQAKPTATPAAAKQDAIKPTPQAVASPQPVAQATASSEPKQLAIKATTSLITAGDAYNRFDKSLRINQTERLRLKVDQIKIEYFTGAKIKTSELAKGKVIYKGENGRIETFIHVVVDQGTWEYMVSYDAKGNYIDCILVGNIMVYGGDRGAAKIEGDKVFYKVEWSEGNEVGTAYGNYTITPDLKFKLDKQWEETVNLDEW